MGAVDGALLGGRYELGTRLGEGGMGVVYKARDRMLSRTVAVKVFREGTTEVARTSSETQLLAGLNHHALVTLFDAHVGEGEPRYLVMEYIDGPTLQSQLESGPLSPDDVVRLARDLGEALHVVHAAGIVHRDVKPANVLLRPSSVPGEQFRAKLADFGIAYLVDSTRLTTPGTVIGSAAYLSPEQVTGASPQAASDIYSLGLVLLEALTGYRAFTQIGAHESALARLTQDPVIPSSVGYAWGDLLTRMTARDPARRPSALDVVVAASDLTAIAPESAASVTVGAGATVAVGVGQAGPTGDAPTLVAPVETAPTAHGDAQTARRDDVTDEPTAAPATTGGRFRWRRWMVVTAGAAAIVAAVIVGSTLLSGGDPATPPALPAVEEPLTSHLEQLLDSVSP